MTLFANVQSTRSLALQNTFTVTVAVFALVLVTYGSTLVELVIFWLNSDEYGHGILLALIAGYLIWRRRDRIAAVEPAFGWPGVLLMSLAQLLHVAATMADMETAKHYSMIMALVSVPLAIGGIRLLRPFLFPLAILLLAIPLPYLVNKLLTTEMQLISSDIGVWFIRLMGMSVYQDGNVIDMGSFVMLVEEACSGLRYLYPLLSISFMLACFYVGSWWMKLVVLVSAIPVTIFMNSLRIALTGWLIKHFGSETAEGFLHDFEGWVIFMVALALMLALIWLASLAVYRKNAFLSYFSFDENRLENGNDGAGDNKASPLPAPQFRPGFVFYALILVLAVGGVSSYALGMHSTEVIPDRETFTDFPLTVGERELYPDTLSQSVLNVLKLDDYFIGDYVADGAPPINLYMAYYAAQTDGGVIHSPRDCLPGGGWEIVSLSPVSLEGTGLAGRANRALIRKGDDALLVYFWVNQQGKNFASELAARTSLLVRSVMQNRTDGTLLRVISPVGMQSEAQAEQEIRQFITEISSELNRFLPN